MENNSQKILITGGLGFLGVNLTEKLLQMNKKPYLLDFYPDSVFKDNPYIPFELNKVFYYKVDLREKSKVIEIFKEINPDVIVHAAALTVLKRDYQTAMDTLDINVKTTINVLEAIKEVGTPKLIFLSTSDIYGELQPPFKEDQLCFPASPYSISKLTGEHYCIMYSNINKIPLIILRIFNIFGKYQKGNRLIPYIIKEILENKSVELTPGEQKREFNYIENIVDAILVSMEIKGFVRDIFNIGSGESLKIKDVALEISEILNKKDLIHLGAIPYRENEIWDMYCDNSHALEKLGWKPRISFKKGLELTIDWFKSNF